MKVPPCNAIINILLIASPRGGNGILPLKKGRWHMTERFTINFEPTGAGVLVTIVEIPGVSALAEDTSIDAIGATGRRLITAHLEAQRKERRPRRQESRVKAS